MIRKRQVISGLFVSLSLTAAQATAQVSEIQVLPPDVNLTVGGQEDAFATVFDVRGNPIDNLAGLNLLWVSSDESVARVQWDPADPAFATIVAVGAGAVQIEALIGTVRSGAVAVFVSGPEPVVPDTVLSADVAGTSVGLVARIEPVTFGLEQQCRVGGFISDNLLLTSYLAIRGADSINVVLANGTRVAGVRVAAYDASTDLAILHVPARRNGSLSFGQTPGADDFVWALGQPGCQTNTTTTGMRVDNDLGLARSLNLGQMGAPIIGSSGELLGIATGETGAIWSGQIAGLAAQANRNLGAGSLLSLFEVATNERHAYGSITLTSDVLGATASVEPLEESHWPELARQSSLPMILVGPMGRYRVDILSSGVVQHTQEIAIQAGVADNVAIRTLVTVEDTPQGDTGQITQQGGGGGGGAIIAVLLIGAAGGGLCVAVLCKSKGPPPPIEPTTGGIKIVVTIP